MTFLKIWLLLSDTVLISLIAILPATVASLGALIVSMKGNRRVEKAVEVIEAVKVNVVEQTVKVAAVVEKVDEVKSVIAEQVQKSEKIVGAVDDYHKEVNGKMSLLLEKTEALAKAEQKIQNGKI